MAATALAVHQISDTPLTDPTDVASDNVNGNTFANSGITLLRFHNTGGSSATVTFAPADSTLGPENLTVSGETKTIASGATQWIGRRDIGTFSRICTFQTSASTLQVSVFEP